MTTPSFSPVSFSLFQTQLDLGRHRSRDPPSPPPSPQQTARSAQTPRKKKISMMNYSNMIEEKNLKRTFIIATLVSTVIGTFTTGIGLWERVGQHRKQKRTDNEQDDQIQKLRQELVKSNEAILNNKRNIKAALREEELERSLRAGGPMIRQEYNRDMRRFGDRFAEGDNITQNQLQGQIITLQSTVIRILEDALYNNKLTEQDVAKLFNASELAREGSLGALQQQYQRMLQAAPISGRPGLAPRRISSTPTLKSLPAPPAGKEEGLEVIVKKSKGREINQEDTVSASGELFCDYGYDLQEKDDVELHASFQAKGDMKCPVCRHVLPLQQGRAWKITKTIVLETKRMEEYDEEVVEDKVFLIRNRYVIKCHRQYGGFACVLCARNRDVDTVCESAEGLVRHVWQKHEAEEYEKEVDIISVNAR